MLRDYPYSKTLVEKIYVELKKRHEHVFLINWDDIEIDNNSILRFKEIKQATQGAHAKILLHRQEPFCFVPGTHIPLQFHNLLHALKKVVLTNVELIFCKQRIGSTDTLFNQQMIQQAIGNNAYGWSWKNLVIPHFPHVIKDPPEIANEIKYKFSYLSHNHRTVRQIFSKFIQKNNIHINNIVAIHTGRGDATYMQPDGEGDGEKSTLFSHPLYTYDEWYYNKNLSELFKNVELKQYVHESVIPRAQINEHNNNFIQQAGIQIIHETVYNYPLPYASEKILNGLLLGRPFVIIGPANSLKALHEAGFKTFAPLIDESYDEMLDPNTRLETIMKLILDINNKSIQQIQDMVNKLRSNCLHNQKILTKMKKDLENNLKDAIIKI